MGGGGGGCKIGHVSLKAQLLKKMHLDATPIYNFKFKFFTLVVV